MWCELGLEEVHRRRPDEACDEEIHRRVVETLRRGHLLQLAVAHHCDAVAHRHRLDLIVRHVDRRHLQRLLDARDLGAHLHAQLRVEVRKRLVHQKRLRLAHDRPSHRDALPLTTGKLSRPALQQVADAEHSRNLLDPALLLGLRNLAHAQTEGEVVVDRLVWIERVVLEHHRDVAVARRQVVHDSAADPDLTQGDFLKAGDHSQRGRLAAARRSDQHHELALGHLEVQVADRDDVVGVDLREVNEPDRGH